MTLRIAAFPEGGQIPVKYSQAAEGAAPGEGTSPEMMWADVPAETQSFVLHMHDIDVVRDRTSDDQLHWVVWNLPAAAVGLPEGVPRGERLPDGSYRVQPVRSTGAGSAGEWSHASLHLRALRIGHKAGRRAAIESL